MDPQKRGKQHERLSVLMHLLAELGMSATAIGTEIDCNEVYVAGALSDTHSHFGEIRKAVEAIRAKLKEPRVCIIPPYLARTTALTETLASHAYASGVRISIELWQCGIPDSRSFEKLWEQVERYRAAKTANGGAPAPPGVEAGFAPMRKRLFADTDGTVLRDPKWMGKNPHPFSYSNKA